jgi:hypothetical protein
MDTRTATSLFATILFGVMLFQLIGLWKTLPAASESLKGSKPHQLYSGAAAWLEKNTAPGARVFQTDWDDFPRLFYYNTHNTYLIGLDPTYLQLYDADLYDLWVDITRGEVARPSEPIFSEFGAAYVMTDLRHENFIRNAADDPGLEEVYQDDDAMIFRVVENACCD